MPFTTVLDELLTEVNTGVDSYLMKFTHSARVIDTKDPKHYSTDSIDRKILPYLNIDCISYVKDKNLDVIVKGMLQKYASERQKSRERELLDYNFDRLEMDAQISKSMNWKYRVGGGVFYLISAVSASFAVATLMTGKYVSSFAPFAGSLAAFPLTLIEHWGPRPIGRLLMSNYTDSITLGTAYYEEKLEKKYHDMIHHYAQKYSPELLANKLATSRNYVPLVSKTKVLDAPIFIN